MCEAAEIRYVNRIATSSEFRELRNNAGWRLPPDTMMRVCLPRSIFGICAETEGGKTVGMGRVVGDGGIQLFITDVIVHSEWQNRGIGTGIMTLLMQQIEQCVTPASFVGLFSALGRARFYEKFGFTVRPDETRGPGMVFILSKIEEPIAK